MKKLLLITMLLSPLANKAQTVVQFYTNYGDFQVEMYDTLMPITTGNFLGLVEDNFYDGVLFHRVIEGFVIQGGYNTPVPPAIDDEFSDETSNVQYTMSMANAGPNTGNSQFFINLVNNTYLDEGYPCFGETIEGFDIVLDIGSVPTNSQDAPIDDVIMDSVRVVDPSLFIFEIQNAPMLVEVYPNPFMESATINFELSESSYVDLSIYDLKGKRINNLINEDLDKGAHTVLWNAGNSPNAVYLLKLQTELGTKTIRLIKK